MALLVRRLTIPVHTEDGTRYMASVYGCERDDGLCEGWLEFSAADGGVVLRTKRETTQTTLEDLAYWASGLEPMYLEGAFRRAQATSSLTAPVSGPARPARRQATDRPA
jgi:hypothetical protein